MTRAQHARRTAPADWVWAVPAVLLVPALIALIVVLELAESTR